MRTRDLMNRVRRIEGGGQEGPPVLVVGCYDPDGFVHVYFSGRSLEFANRAEYEAWREKGSPWE